MGRKEKRLQDKQKRRESKDNLELLRKLEARKAEEEKMEHIAAYTDAFMFILHEDYGFDTEKLYEVLDKVDQLIAKIGNSEEYRNLSEYKIKCALATGIDVGLNVKEKATVQEIYDAAWNNKESENYTVEEGDTNGTDSEN